jgi:hypothetical protein
MWSRLASSLLVLTTVLVGCGGGVVNDGTSSGPNDEVALDVTVNAFSGRENPKWTLRPDEVRDVRGRIQGLTAAGAPENFPKLGELNFVVTNNGKVPSLPDRIVAGRGLVGLEKGRTTSWFTDEKKLFGFLSDSARTAGVLPNQ